MFLMLVIFGKFSSFFFFWGGGGEAGRGVLGGTRRPLYSIFMESFTVASKQGALYLVMGNNAIGPSFAAGYRIFFFFFCGGEGSPEASLFSNIICTISMPGASK